MESIIAKNLSEIIQKKGIKKCVVAERAGLTPNMLSDMLNGRKIIRESNILSLAAVLEVTPNDLFGINEKIC